jgi:hypothetical protein
MNSCKDLFVNRNHFRNVSDYKRNRRGNGVYIHSSLYYKNGKHENEFSKTEKVRRKTKKIKNEPYQKNGKI